MRPRDSTALDYLDKREVKRHDRVSQFAVAASTQALASAGLDGHLPARIQIDSGVIFRNWHRRIATFEEQHRKLIEKGPKRVSPFFIPMFIPGHLRRTDFHSLGTARSELRDGVCVCLVRTRDRRCECATFVTATQT